MELGRLYSRICGWENGTPVKYFNSSIFNIFNKNIFDIDGKNGQFIAKFLESNSLTHLYNDAYKICKNYPSWYFYYGENKIITST